MNTNIIPAVMPETFDEISRMVSLVKNDVSLVQIDIMDGKYVPEKTWPFHYGTDRDLEALKNEALSFPFWEELNYELDLMVERPEEQLETWLHIGASRIVFHYASVHNWELIRTVDPIIRNFITIGMGVTVHDNLKEIYSLLDEKIVDFVQVMGISHIGYQGEPFEESSLDIIKELRNRYPDLLITVDGGVSLETISDLQGYGANEFVSGSAVFGHGVALENIRHLQEMIKE